MSQFRQMATGQLEQDHSASRSTKAHALLARPVGEVFAYAGQPFCENIATSSRRSMGCRALNCLGFELHGVNQNVAVLFHPGYMGAPTISEVVLTLDVDDVIRFGEFYAPVQEKAVESIFAGEHEPHPVEVLLFHGADPIAAEIA
jgi:hypothetical protein